MNRAMSQLNEEDRGGEGEKAEGKGVTMVEMTAPPKASDTGLCRTLHSGEKIIRGEICRAPSPCARLTLTIKNLKRTGSVNRTLASAFQPDFSFQKLFCVLIKEIT